MLNILLIGCGGFLGSVLRYLIGHGVQHLVRPSTFPYGTLSVNLAGCLLIGFLGGIAQHRDIFNPAFRLFLFTGLLGGFTTFSTFGYDTVSLGRDIDLSFAVLNVLLHIALGLGAVLLGIWLSRWC